MEDPRYYVSVRPVPAWDMAKDAKLRARSLNQYNLGSPTRYEMFKYNYTRRLRQMSSQGFMSAPSKPYRPVGTLVLNPKDLIRKTLGQHKDEIISEQTQQKSVEKNTSPITTSPRKQRNSKRPATAPITKARESTSNQRASHQLHNIPASLTAVESTKHSVKMGHSLFEVLVTKPTPVSIQSTGTRDSPVMRKQSIEQEQLQAGPKSLPVPKWLVNFEKEPVMAVTEKSQLHSDSYSTIDSISQMCALHWLIEACRIRQGLRDLSPGEVLVPLAKCWDEVNPGGRTMPRVLLSHLSLERYASTSSLQVPSRSLSRSTSASSIHATSNSAKGSSYATNKFRERFGSKEVQQYRDMPSIHETSRSATPTPTIILPDRETIDERTIDDDPIEDNEMSNYHNNLVKLLDTVKESVDKEMQFRKQVADDKADKKGRLRSPVYKWALSPYPKTPKGVLTVTIPAMDTKPPDLPRQPSPVARKTVIRPHTAGPRMKNAGRRDSFRSGSPVPPNNASKQEKPAPKRPKSSPPKLRLNDATFSSDQREKTMIKLREQFQEVADMKALRLHQSLSELHRSRTDRIEKKFEAFDVCQLSIDRDLRTMRSAIQNEGALPRADGRYSVASAAGESEWFTKMLNMTSLHEATDKPCKTVLEHLKKSAATFMGWQEDSKGCKRRKPVNIMDHQITLESFAAVLRQLRNFEMFSPDVSAAIEFMKNEIVKVPNEQFEDIVKKITSQSQ